MNGALERRVQQALARTLVRAWEYRQRRHARGAWFRFRRVLADADAAFIVAPEAAAQLVAEGHRAEPIGQEFEPPKLIVFAPADRVARLASARAVPVRLDGELLAAPCVVLTPFER